MKMKVWLAMAAMAAFTPVLLVAQAPAGSTGQCKDGSYTSAATKSGACRGHKGIQTWYATAGAAGAPATAPQPAAKMAPAPQAAIMPAPMPQPARQTPAPGSSARSKTVAPGGGPGMVWVNTASKVYHCPGTANYGTTKEGKYMSEASAKTMGAHADHGRPCTK